ncbi:MAG: hypothetical protein RhofKO_11190 [Rhodothermales bacterium]
MRVRLIACFAYLCLLGGAGIGLGVSQVWAQAEPAGETSRLVEELATSADEERLSILAELINQTYRSQPEEAVRYSEKALALLARFPDEALKRHVLMQTGRAYDALRDTTRMFDYAERLDRMGETLAAGHAAYLTGRARIRQRDYAAAETSLTEALDRYTVSASDEHRAAALYSLGIATRRQGELETAHDYYEQASLAFADLGNVRSQGDARYWMGRVALDAEAFAYAAEVLTDAISLREAAGDTLGWARAHHSAGEAYEEQGDYAPAFVHHTQAFALREALGATFDMATSLNALGDLHEDQGDLGEARTLYQRAQVLFREVGRLDGVAATTNNIGTTHLAAEEWAEAKVAFTTYLDLSRELGDPVREARAYQNLGVAYTGQGDASTALDYFEQARALFRAQGRREPLADTYRSTAEALAATGAYEDALAATDSALVLSEAIGALPVAHEAHLVRSAIFEEMGRYEEALAALQAAEAAEDALYSPASQAAIAEVQGAFQTREQKRQIEALEREQQAQRQWLMALMAGLALLGIIAALLASRYQARRREVAALERARQAEAERIAGLEQADALKSQFLANISHELRTPLTLAMGPVHDLLDGRFETMDEAEPHFARAQRNGQRLLRLINQLLDVAELDADAVELYLQPHDLVAFCREIAALFEDFAQQRGLTLTTELPAEQLLVVFDGDHMEKIVANLLSNAIKFTPVGGTIRLAVAQEEDTVCLVVKDTGEGIAKDHLPHLFDRFYQAEQASTRRHEGSGIGLALVKELVELHQGRVEAESTLGEGTTVRMYLPATLTPTVSTTSGDGHPIAAESTYVDVAESPSEPEGASASEHPVLLIVEDNADMRAYLRSHLAAAFDLLEAANGAAGLVQAQEQVPDLIISDVMMPGMDGYALTHALKSDVRTSHIPVLLLTARGAVADQVAGFASGADAYLPKPFDATLLRVRIDGLLAERERLRQRYGHASEAATTPSTEPALPAPEADFLHRLDAELDAHLGDVDYGVDALAEALHLSLRQATRKVKALTGETPGALLRERRLAHAAVLLREGQAVKVVAAATGFRSAATFSRAFGQVYGMPPAQYAAQQR